MIVTGRNIKIKEYEGSIIARQLYHKFIIRVINTQNSHQKVDFTHVYNYNKPINKRTDFYGRTYGKQG